MFFSRIFVLTILSVLASGVTGVFDTGACEIAIRRGNHGTTIGLGSHGQPIVNISEAKGVNYTMCLSACGHGVQAFEWSLFSQQFNAWVIPWLALLSQLPFGAQDRLDNVMAVLLAVGSPALAAYSLALTLLNHRWLEKHISQIRYQNTRHVLSVFSALQHIPIQMITRGPLLPSLVVLSENDRWWSEMAERAEQTRNWNVPAAVNVAWVLIAFLFTIINSFDDFGSFVSSHGHAVASMWMWLLPVVVGWLKVGSQTESGQLQKALRHSNKFAYVATADGIPILARELSDDQALVHAAGEGSRVRRDEERAAPIFNYARAFFWSQATDHVIQLYDSAALNAARHTTVDKRTWVCSGIGRDSVHDDNRIGNVDEVINYCHSREMSGGQRSVLGLHSPRWPRGVITRMAVAMLLALFLQWATSGAAMLISVMTPPVALGCRSMAYLLYASAATVSLVCLVFSSILAHASRPSSTYNRSHRGRTIEALAIVLRWTGKTIAVMNAFGIIAACTFQFTHVYSNCFCLSSVIGLGKDHAYILFLTGDDLIALGTRSAWVGGVMLATISALLYGAFIHLISSTLSS